MQNNLTNDEIKLFNECTKYLKKISKLKSPQREYRIFFEYAVLKELRETLNCKIRDIERNLYFWDYDKPDLEPLSKLCKESMGEFALRNFDGIDEFTIKVDLYLFAFQNICDFTIYEDDIDKQVQRKIVDDLIHYWFNQIPTTYTTINVFKAEHLLFSFHKATTLSLICMQADYRDCEKDVEEFYNDHPEIALRNRKLYDAQELARQNNPYLNEYNFRPIKLLNDKEIKYYHAIRRYLQNLNESATSMRYYIHPQISLIKILNKYRGNAEVLQKYKYDLYNIIDFGIFDNNFNIKFAIEVNGDSHDQIDRMARDIKVKHILESAKIPLITFDLSNEQNYSDIDQIVAEKFKFYEDLK